MWSSVLPYSSASSLKHSVVILHDDNNDINNNNNNFFKSNNFIKIRNNQGYQIITKGT